MEKILIKEARIYDPAQQWRGEPRDLYLEAGRVSPPFSDPKHVIHAAGRPLMAGGIDPYCQLAGQGQSFNRMTMAQPGPEEIGRSYARMGYVHIHQPFMTLLTAGLVHRYLRLIPHVDHSACVSIDLREMGHSIKASRPDDFVMLARASIRLSSALGLFLPFPFLRHKQRHYLHKNISAKKVLGFLSQIDDPELLPITLWGMPGLMENEIPAPDRFHISGLGAALDSDTALDQARALLEAGVSADMGLSSGEEQLMIMSHQAVPAGSLSIDTGLLCPLYIQTQPLPLDSDPGRAGWSLMDGVEPHWRLSLSASGLTGGQPGCLPYMAPWLLNPDSCPGVLQGVFNNSNLDLYELARMTRLEPARVLGLDDLGHLAAGAKASIAIYDMDPEEKEHHRIAETLSNCWCLVKDGVLLRENREFTGRTAPAVTRHREMDVDLSVLSETGLLQNSTLRSDNLQA